MHNVILRTQASQVKSFLRWAGSKRQLIPHLHYFWNSDYKRYIEPFAGSASLFFALTPKRALLGDINSQLIETYSQVRSNLSAVLRILRRYKKGKEEYLRIRSVNPESLSPPGRSARFIYLNRYCFNGLYRTNGKGTFNVPYGGEKTGKLPTNDHLKRCSSILQNAVLRASRFENTLLNAKSGDLVYMDPPFRVKSKRVFNEYDASTFSQDDLENLRRWMIRLDDKNITFLVSYAESDEAIYLRQGFSFSSISVRRSIAGFSGNRKSATELLITNDHVAMEKFNGQ